MLVFSFIVIILVSLLVLVLGITNPLYAWAEATEKRR